MRCPSTWMMSLTGSALSPSFATLPLTVTRRAAISSSLARRDPTPAAAITFCRRSRPSVSALLIGDLLNVVRQERCQWRKLVDRVEAELLQEQGGGAVEVRAGLGFGPALLDHAASDQGTDDTV